jgi:phosphatidyl-myo-inositol alpha-mannosyltransferase
VRAAGGGDEMGIAEGRAASNRDTVVFVSMSRGIGGPARSLLTVLANLSDDIDRVLFAPQGDLAALAQRDGLVTTYLPMPYELRFRQRSRLRAAAVLTRYVRTNRERILAIHANGQTDLNLAAPAMLLGRAPVVMWAHTSRASPTAGSLRWLWRRARRVTWLAVSETARHTLATTLGLDPDDVRVVMNPIDPPAVVGEHVATDSIRVAYLGLAAPHKGFDLLADIYDRLDRDDVGLDLYVAPPDPHLPLELRPPWEALHAISQERDVVFRGRVTDVSTAFGRSDIVLCPSRQESFGRIAAEAMMNGLPVVASDIPAYRELVGDPGGGLLFPVGDAAAAAALVSRLAGDPELRREVGERGRAHVQRFAPRQIVPQLEACYRSAGNA